MYNIEVLPDHVITVLPGELHLVPLKKILQLHPDFGYLDKAVLGDQKMAREREGIMCSVCLCIQCALIGIFVHDTV